MWGQILGAVAGPVAGALVGNALGRKGGQGTNFVKLRRDAEKAGFNPLTALMATGGQGYQRTFQPDLASGSFVAEAVNRGVDTYFNATNAAEDREAVAVQQAATDRRVLDGLAALPRDTFGYDLTKQRFPVVPVTSGKPPLVRGGDKATSDEGYTPSTKPLTVASLPLKPSGWWSDADAIETRYGDVASWMYGLGALSTDLGKNVYDAFTARLPELRQSVRLEFARPPRRPSPKLDPVTSRKQSYQR